MSALIGIIGDRNPNYRVHLATEAALSHIPDPIGFEWVATDDIGGAVAARLSKFAGLIVAPGSPYRDMDGALAAIRHARESGVPLLGTCGGFQHLVLEFARNVLGVADAEHAETAPDAPRLAIAPLVCSLAGTVGRVRFAPGSRVAEIYGSDASDEPFFCSYGLNPEYREPLETAGARVTGTGEDGAARVVEVADHPFLIGTLFVPQAGSRPGAPHPLIVALAAAARARA